MSKYVNTFNDQFEELLDDIQHIFPEDTDISTASIWLKRMRRINPTVIIKIFYDYVDKPYGAYIHDNNLSYFLEKDYSQDLSGYMFSNEILAKIAIIKKPISIMNPVQQLMIIKYFQNLCNLSTLYINHSRGLKIR